MDSRATPDPEVGREAIFDTDTEIGIDGASKTYATEPISDPVSTAPGLPDFTAIIMAEIAAAEAANESHPHEVHPSVLESWF